MMNELAYSDIIRHYKLKMQECNENIKELNKQIAVFEELGNEAWQGASAKAFLDKLDEMQELLCQISSAFEESIEKLQGIEGFFGE